MNVVYKTNIECSFIRGMVETYCGKFNFDLLFTLPLRAPGAGLSEQQAKVDFHLGTIISHHPPHEQSIFVYNFRPYRYVYVARFTGAYLRHSSAVSTFNGYFRKFNLQKIFVFFFQHLTFRLYCVYLTFCTLGKAEIPPERPLNKNYQFPSR